MYSPKEIKIIQAHILDEMSEGRSLKNILDNDKHVPSRMTVYEWLNPKSDYYNEKFSYNYDRALQERSDLLVDEMLEIADDVDGDVNRDRLRVDTRKWSASKMKPKKYGDSQLLKLGDNEGGELKVNAIFNIDLLGDVLPNDSTKEDREPKEND